MFRTVPIGRARSGGAVFRRGSNVLEYWLDHAEGFEIRSGRRARARVESVVVDPHSGRAEGLVVRSSRLRRRRLIPAESIVAVDPFARVLVPRAERSTLARWGAATGRRTIAFVVVTMNAGRRTAVWIGPRLQRALTVASGAAHSAAIHFAAAVAWLSPRAWALAKAAAVRCASEARGRSLAGPTPESVDPRCRDSYSERLAAARTRSSSRRHRHPRDAREVREKVAGDSAS